MSFQSSLTGVEIEERLVKAETLLGPTIPGSSTDPGDPGYFGEVSAFDFIYGDVLAKEIGLTAGTEQESDCGWLKFKHNLKTLFIAKRSLRNNLSWDDINAINGVYGGLEIRIKGYKYKVRLMTGCVSDPSPLGYSNTYCSDDVGAGSEWNELIYRVYSVNPICSDPNLGTSSYPERHGGPQVGDNWASMTDGDLNIGTGDGRAVWCQETGADSSRRVRRGMGGVAYFFTNASGGAAVNYGWRPCLELIEA